MESEEEARRLAEQARALPIHGHLLTTGLATGMKALDAGCGPGIITSVMAEVVGRQGSVLAVDAHPQRLEEARAHCAQLPQCSFRQADVRKLDLPEGTFDYVWSQFVLEYLKEPEAALAELIRVTRPGGRVVISEVDEPGRHIWPCPPDIEEGFRKFNAAVAAAGLDLQVGRKMFYFFRRAGLEQIRVHLAPLWVVAGAADGRLLNDWKQRFATLEPVVAPSFGGVEAYRASCERYLELLSDPDALKYSVLLITEGRKR
jgi:ubiquinone/menaquinone biosynthesis C-methylase UbiE